MVLVRDVTFTNEGSFSPLVSRKPRPAHRRPLRANAESRSDVDVQDPPRLA